MSSSPASPKSSAGSDEETNPLKRPNPKSPGAKDKTNPKKLKTSTNTGKRESRIVMSWKDVTDEDIAEMESAFDNLPIFVNPGDKTEDEILAMACAPEFEKFRNITNDQIYDLDENHPMEMCRTYLVLSPNNPELVDFARDAMKHYNQVHGHSYEFVNLEKAVVVAIVYYLTFKAKDNNGGTRTFQTQISYCPPNPLEKREVLLVKEKEEKDH